MGSSTDAILFYGICWDAEDHQWNWRPYIDPDMDASEVAEASPLPVKERISPDDEDTTDQEWVDQNVGAGLHVGEHCCGSAPMGYVAVSESHHYAWRGAPNRMDPTGIHDNVSVEWLTLIRAFCLIAHYDYDELVREGKIGWFLVSWWSE